MPHTSETPASLLPIRRHVPTPHHVSSELGGSPNGRSRPVKVFEVDLLAHAAYPGDGSDCDQPALKLVSEHAGSKN